MNTKRMVGIVAVAIAMLVALTSVSPVMAQDVSPVVEGIHKNLDELKEANHVIHVQTDVILGGLEEGDLADMVETTHLSSHGILYIMPKLEAALTELDAYKANPKANAGKILVAKGKLEILCEMADEIPGTTKFSGLMEWPNTETSPHDLVHVFMTDPAITGVTEYKTAADALHESMHGIEGATSTMEGNLNTLEDVIGELEAAKAQDVSPVVEGIHKNLDELKEANHVIHVQTDVILGGLEEGDLADMVETTHLSSHGILYIMPKLEAALTELDAYKANPKANAGKILVAKGKLEILCEMADEIPGTTKFSGLMEWPNTETSPHDLVHVFMTDPAITGVTEYKTAADALHESMHGIEGATSTMEGNLDTLEDVIGELGAPAAPAATPAAPTATPKEPGFEAVFAIAGILAIAYLVLRRTR